MNQQLIDALNWRYATKVFDPARRVTDDDLRTILESGRLAPSIGGIEPWKFLVVENKNVRQKVREAAHGQPKVTDASHLVILARRSNARQELADELINRAAKTHDVHPDTLGGLRATAEGIVHSSEDHAHDAMVQSQVFLALGLMVATASLLGIDNGPMAGSPAIDQALGLSKRGLASTAMLTLGYRGDDPAAKRAKVRRDFDEAVEFIR